MWMHQPKQDPDAPEQATATHLCDASLGEVGVEDDGVLEVIALHCSTVVLGLAMADDDNVLQVTVQYKSMSRGQYRPGQRQQPG